MNNNLKIDLINNLLNNRKLYQIISQTGKAYITQKTTKKLYFLEKYLSGFTNFKFPLFFHVRAKLFSPTSDFSFINVYTYGFYLKNLKELFKFFFKDDTYHKSIYRILIEISQTCNTHRSQNNIIRKIKNKLLKNNNIKQKMDIINNITQLSEKYYQNCEISLYIGNIIQGYDNKKMKNIFA